MINELDVKIFAYDVIEKSLNEWGYEDTSAFNMYLQGVVDMANKVIEWLNSDNN